MDENYSYESAAAVVMRVAWRAGQAQAANETPTAMPSQGS